MFMLRYAARPTIYSAIFAMLTLVRVSCKADIDPSVAKHQSSPAMFCGLWYFGEAMGENYFYYFNSNKTGSIVILHDGIDLVGNSFLSKPTNLRFWYETFPFRWQLGKNLVNLNFDIDTFFTPNTATARNLLSMSDNVVFTTNGKVKIHGNRVSIPLRLSITNQRDLNTFNRGNIRFGEPVTKMVVSSNVGTTLYRKLPVSYYDMIYCFKKNKKQMDELRSRR